MYPRLGGMENLDGLPLYYPILAIAVVVVNGGILWSLGRRGYSAVALIPVQLAVSVGGFGGAKLYSILFRGRVGSLDQELETGWRYPGALLGMIVAAAIAKRLLPGDLTPRGYLDAWAPSIALACAIGRVGCFLHGCCYGAISQMSWAIQYPFGSIVWYAHRNSGNLPIEGGGLLSAAVHPFPLYLFLMEVLLGLYLFQLRSRARYDGQVVLHFLAIHGLAKAALEVFRDPFSWMHVVVLPIGLVALALLGMAEWGFRARSRSGALSIAQPLLR